MKEELGVRVGRWAVARPVWAICLSLLVTAIFGAGLRHIYLESQYRYFFGKDNPQLREFDKLQKVYAKDDSVLVVIAPQAGDVFSPNTLRAVERLTELAWKTPYSTRVDSLTNFQFTQADEDSLVVQNLVPDASALDEAQLATIRREALREPMLRNRLVTEKSNVTAVNISVSVPGKSPTEVPEVAKFVREMAQQIEREFPGHKTYLTGMIMLNNAFFEAGSGDMMRLTPLMYLVIIVIMTLLLRSIAGVIATLGVVFLAMIGALGFAGWAGIPISPPSAIAPTVVLTLGIADSVHVLSTVFSLMRRGKSKKEALIESLRVNFQPVLLTSLTTVIGFLSLNASDSPPYHDLGNITAVGVSLAFVFSVVLLPAVMSMLPTRVRARPEAGQQLFARLGDFVIARRLGLTIGLGLGSIFLISQIPRLTVNDQFVEYFDRSIKFRTDTDFITDNLTGVYLMQFDVRAKESQGVTSPEYIRNLEAFGNWLHDQPDVLHVNSFTDVMKRINRSMHGDDDAYYRLPENRELAAQYLLLYEMSLPFGLDLTNQIDIDKSSSRVIVTLNGRSTKALLDLAARSDRWLKDNTPSYMHATAAGPAVMFSHITERNIEGMVRGSILAFLLITIIMILSLKSIKYGMISLVPNVIPAGIAFGIWYFLKGEVGFAVSVVTSVTLGIIVDDTVHFLSKYVRARREGKRESMEAIRYAFSSVGAALVITSVILVVGFSVLMTSPFKLNATLGALSAMTVAIALGVDLLLLPGILALVDRSSIKGTSKVSGKSLAGAAMLLLGLGSFAAVAKAEDPAAKGLAIARKVDEVNNGFGDETADAEMLLRNQHGQQTVRLLKLKTLEVENDGDKSLVIFKNPRDVKGTAFLSFTHKRGNDDQWLYLPALRRVKRISSNNKSGPFMGSEFAYEDISSQEVEKYTYKFVRDDSIEGKAVHVVERYPVDESSGYTRQIVFIDSVEYIPLRIEYFDRKHARLKTLKFSEYQKYRDKYWRPHRMEMVNHTSGKSTVFSRKNFQFANGFTDRDFDKSALKRAR